MSSDSYNIPHTLAKDMQMAFGKRVRELREMRGLSLRKLGQKIGCSGQTVHDWETGRIDPNRVSRNYLDGVASVLGTTVEYLLTGRADTNPKVRLTVSPVREMVDDIDDTGVLLVVNEMDIGSAGPGMISAEFIETEQKRHFPRAFLQNMGVTAQDVRLVCVFGDSMQPTLWNGDVAMIDLSKTRIRNDHVFAIGYAGEARFKRLQKLADGTLRIISDNPDKVRFPDEFIGSDETENMVVIGQVIHKSGSGGL